jgi:23S rRNA (cytosine1962-C5)-methyltransferase
LGSSSPEILLRPGKDSAVRKRRHPWIYSQAVRETRGEPGSGLLRVIGADGSVLGWGFHTEGSLIAVRMVSFGPDKPPVTWVRDGIRAAYRLRRDCKLDSDAYRLINAEGDFMPGLVIDVYADTAVISFHVKGMEALTEEIVAGLEETLPGMKVYLKRDEHYSRIEGLERPSGYLRGEGDGTSIIREDGLSFLVDFAQGQKTGFYLDQRENRRIAGGLASGRRVLNLFCYTGGFSLQAARGGALGVVSVDSSAHAIGLCKKNAELNPQIDASALDWRRQDVSDCLQEEEKYGLIVVDPPPFARRRAERDGALRGYLTLNQRVMSLVEPGGYVLSFSCSGAVSRDDFRQVLSHSAVRSGRRARFLRELGTGVDHPVSTDHPEGEYLKGWLLHVE